MPGPFDNTAAVILAGGFGTRIRHLAPDVPKPMISVAGRPFVEWLVRQLQRVGIREVVLSTGHLADVVARHFDSQPVPGVHVRCVPEESPLSTAGGFVHAAKASGLKPDRWLVLNGDSMIQGDLTSLADALGTKSDGAILGVEMDDAARYGSLEFDTERRLTQFAEKRPGAGVINAGVYLLRASTLERFPAKRPLSFEVDVFPELIAGGGEFKVATVRTPFLDIGTPESLAQAESFVTSLKTSTHIESQAQKRV